MLKTPRKEDGFTLLETMAAIFVIVVCLTVMAPIATRVYMEREALSQAETALSVLNNALIEWSAGREVRPAVIEQNQTSYHLLWQEAEPGKMGLCVQWKSRTGRTQKLCGEIKR
ncbi:type II secretion system protein [Tuberibacillus calidus]|jgi:prepilin-type N-terminal cleavage/methylation domain-containing protein|uniref:type II secretion system protein n=1 Tax=Tuberibacillus calidus TaxID=340097 RepID=UPI00040FFEF3|nr:type II secretion system protein [Tuberibacillus calidus]